MKPPDKALPVWVSVPPTDTSIAPVSLSPRATLKYPSSSVAPSVSPSVSSLSPFKSIKTRAPDTGESITLPSCASTTMTETDADADAWPSLTETEKVYSLSASESEGSSKFGSLAKEMV